MRTLLAFLFVSFFVSTTYPQEIPRFNIGAGYPFLNIYKNYSLTGGEISFDGNRLNLFAEVPALIRFKNNPGFYISPGLSFIKLNENQSSGSLGGSNFIHNERYAFSIYSRLIYHPGFKFVGNNNWNFGLVTGYYLYSYLKGSQTWTLSQEGPDYHGLRDYEGDSSSFFKSFYFGFTTGFQFNIKQARLLKPAFELAFYPDFVNILDEFLGENNKNISHNMLMGSIVLGFGSKPLFKQNEK